VIVSAFRLARYVNVPHGSVRYARVLSVKFDEQWWLVWSESARHGVFARIHVQVGAVIGYARIVFSAARTVRLGESVRI